jgi:dCTP deaminase
MARRISPTWDMWIPGVLSKRQMTALVEKGHIRVEGSGSIGASSLDLTLSSEVYHLPDGTIKPSGPLYHQDLARFGKRLDPMTEKGLTLPARETYLVKLREQFANLRNSHIHGQATAKSSVGRVDVLARLVVDGMDCYEYFDSQKVDTGELYLEITPLTFSVLIKPGISLNQLRLFYGPPERCLINGPEASRTFIKTTEGESNESTLTVDLEPTDVRGNDVIAFRAKDPCPCEPIPLWTTKGATKSSPWLYWDFVRPNPTKRLSLKKGSFYILKSKERLALPKGVAVYCRAIDEAFGEMRIHYAGFAHPWFGLARNDQTGTPLIFEVRGHDVNVSLRDGESMARLQFYRMSEDAERGDEDPKGPYERQTLKLSDFFADWPKKLVVDESGAVQPVQ